MVITDYYTVIKIGGVDVTNYVLRYSSTDSSLERIDRCKITCSPAILADSNVVLTTGSEVTIQRGSSASNLIYLFRGYINLTEPDNDVVELGCYNKLWLLQQRQVTTSFDKNIDSEAGKLSEIILTLITRYGGLSADSSSIQDSGTTFTLNKYICVNDEVFERIMKLVDALGWQLYYNPVDDKVYCEEFGFRKYSGEVTFGLSSSTVPLVSLPTLTYDYTQLVNKVTINGAKQLDTINETFSGDDSTTNFTLTYTPLQTKVLIGSTEQTRGVKSGDTTTFDYWIEEDLKRLSFVTAPVTGTDNVSIEYSAMVPVPVILDDADSIDLYCPTNPTTGEKTPFHKTFTYTDIIDVDDAINRGKEVLSIYNTPFITYSIQIAQSNPVFFPGLEVTINDEINGYEGTLVVEEVVRQYPEPNDIIRLSDKRNFVNELGRISERVAKLEKEVLRNIGTIFTVKSLRMEPVDIQRRYMKMTSNSIAGETLIYDHPLYGIYDTAKYASATLNSFILGSELSGVLGTNQLGSQTTTAITIRLIPGNGSFKEYLYDTEFVDTTNSTATVDTTNMRVYP